MGPETEGGNGQTGSLRGKGAWGRSFLSLGQRGSGVTLSEPPRFITRAGMRMGGLLPGRPPSLRLRNASRLEAGPGGGLLVGTEWGWGCWKE